LEGKTKSVVAVRSNLVAWRNEPSSLMSRREKPLTRGRDEFLRDLTPPSALWPLRRRRDDRLWPTSRGHPPAARSGRTHPARRASEQRPIPCLAASPLCGVRRSDLYRCRFVSIPLIQVPPQPLALAPPGRWPCLCGCKGLQFVGAYMVKN
jgi:hypothetical protein